LKFLVALVVMSAAVVASLMLGDDAQLRAAGQSISRWLTGNDRALQAVPLAPASPPAAAEGEAAERAR